MSWNPSPTDIILQHETGLGNMGSLAYGEGADVNRVARFWIPGKFVLAFIRGHFGLDFEGGGSSYADLTINVDSRLGKQYNTGLKTLRDVGVGGKEVNFRIPAEEHFHWIFVGGKDGSKGDEIVVVWTNPNTNVWGLEVGLIPIEEEN